MYPALQNLALAEHALDQVLEDEDFSTYYSDHPHQLSKPKILTTKSAIAKVLEAADASILAAGSGTEIFKVPRCSPPVSPVTHINYRNLAS